MTTYMHLTRAELEAKLAEAERERIEALDRAAHRERQLSAAFGRESAAESREKALREVTNDARELFEIIARGVGNNAGHRARAIAWLHRCHLALAAGEETT